MEFLEEPLKKPWRNSERKPREAQKKLLKKLRSKSWNNSEEILAGTPVVTLKEFPQNSGKILGGALVDFLKDVTRHYWGNSEKVLGEMPGVTLKEFLVKLLRNS